MRDKLLKEFLEMSSVLEEMLVEYINMLKACFKNSLRNREACVKNA